MILSELRAQGWKFGCIGALAALLGASAFAGVQSYRLQVAKGAAAILAADAERATRLAGDAARAEEQARAQLVNVAADQYERGKRDAQAAAGRVADQLRAGNVRLRAEIRALGARGVPGDPRSAGQPSDAAERGAGLIGAAVGIGAQCDAAQRALIQAYDAARGEHPSGTGN